MNIKNLYRILLYTLSNSYNNGTNLEEKDADNLITMPHMKSTNKSQTLKQTIHLKNLIVLFGVCLCFLTVTSFNNWSSSDDASSAQGSQRIVEDQVIHKKEIPTAKQEQKFRTHHNFIASYLLQESSFERKIKKTEDRGDFFSNLKQLHKVIITQTLGSF